MSRAKERPSDLDLAVNELLSSEGSIVVAFGGKIVLRGDGPGIKPVLEAQQVLGEGLIGAAVADTVLGKAAALFLEDAGVTSVFGEVLSEHAREYLESAGVYVEGETVVDFIANRSGDDLCPLEKIAVETGDPDMARKAICEFISKAQ